MVKLVALIVLAGLMPACMGSPKSFTNTTPGGGFTGTPPPSKPIQTTSNTNVMVSSGGAISFGTHVMTRLSVGEFPQATVMSGPNTQMAISLQPSLMDQVGL
jgi:hypothetical protein